MSTLAKVFVVLNLLLILVFVTVSGVLFAHEQQWKERAVTFQAKLADKTADYEQLDKEMSDKLALLEDKNFKLGEALNVKETELSDKDREIDQLKEDKRMLKKATDSLEASYDSLNQQWVSTNQGLQATVAELDRRNAELRRVLEDKTRTDEQVVLLTARIGENQRLINRLNDTIQDKSASLATAMGYNNVVQKRFPDVWQVVLEDGPAGEITPVINAKVTGVRSDVNLVMLSVGREDKVKVNMKFIVYRGSEYVGEVIVDEVAAQHCAARIVLTNLPFQKGDEATTQLGS